MPSAKSQCGVIRRGLFATAVIDGITLSALIWISRPMSLQVTLKIYGSVKPIAVICLHFRRILWTGKSKEKL